MPTLRLLTYNVRSLRDDSAAVVRVIRAADADVVCLQEAPRFRLWRLRCWTLARRSGLRWVAGGRGAGANLVLTRRSVVVASGRDLALSSDPGLHLRGAAVAVLDSGRCRVVVAGTHLDLVPGPRLRHVGELRDALRAIASDTSILIVAGDLNERPGGPAWRAMEQIGTDAFAASGIGPGQTFPAVRPTKRIDGVFVAGATVRSARVIDSDDVRVASDHRPMLVEITLPAY